MSAAFALFMLAQAAAACPPAGDVRLPGGATIVRPVGTDEPLPVEKLGPATGIEKPDIIHKTGADADGEKPEAAPPAAECDPDPIEMV
jgi:hypothetical protein